MRTSIAYGVCALALVTVLAQTPAVYTECSAPGTQEKSFTLIACGDNLIHSTVYKDAYRGGAYDFRYIYECIKPEISGADIAFVNQETSLGASGHSGYPRFCSPFEVGDALRDTGFDVINIANNHMLDRGEEGIERTYKYLSSLGLTVTGNGSEPVYTEVNGIRVAFISFTYATNYGISARVPVYERSVAERRIGEARKNADTVIVSMHWGVEYDSGVDGDSPFEITYTQRKWADELCGAGADIIIGNHPHVLQRVEYIEYGGRECFVAYSLGNLVSNMRYGKTQLGGMLSLEVTVENGVSKVKEASVIPIVCHCNETHREYRVYKLYEYTDALASTHGTNDEANKRKFNMNTLEGYYFENIQEKFREYGRRKEND